MELFPTTRGGIKRGFEGYMYKSFFFCFFFFFFFFFLGGGGGGGGFCFIWHNIKTISKKSPASCPTPQKSHRPSVRRSIVCVPPFSI